DRILESRRAHDERRSLAGEREQAKARENDFGCEKRDLPLIPTVIAAVKTFAQFLAGAEERSALFFDDYGFAGARIAPLTRRADFHRECPKAAQFHAMAFGQSLGDLVEHRGHDPLDIAVIKMWVALREPRNQLGFDHPPDPRGHPFCRNRPKGRVRWELLSEGTGVVNGSPCTANAFLARWRNSRNRRAARGREIVGEIE